MLFIKKKNLNNLIILPFLLSIASFIIYFRYLFLVKNNSKITINSIILISLYRYRNIAIFSLAVGIFLILVKTIINYVKIEKEYNEINLKNKDYSVLDKISVSNRIKVEKKEQSYLDITDSKIVNDLLNNKTLKLKFVNSESSNKKVKFKNYDSKEKIIEFYDLSTNKKTIKEEKIYKYKKIKRKISYIVDLILILLMIMLVLLVSVEISKKSDVNRKNLNIEKTASLLK